MRNFRVKKEFETACHLGQRWSKFLVTEVAASAGSRRYSPREASRVVDMKGVDSGLGFCYVRELDVE
jgi:hypothetical protein